jgi:CRP-like cAMP-binding protein
MTEVERSMSLGDLLYSIYFIREGQIEILQNNESQAILGQNDILGENPCNTMTPGKSRCVVKGRRHADFRWS